MRAFFETERIDWRLDSNNTTIKIQPIYYFAHLNRSLMHPHSDHSYEHPMVDVDNSQWKFHSPDTEHRPAKSFHFLDQTVHCVEHWQQTNTQVVDRQLEHHSYPSYRHKPFPRYLCNWSPLCPLQTHFLQSVSNLLVYKLGVFLFGFWKTNKQNQKLYTPICYNVIHTEYFKMKNVAFLCNLHRTSVNNIRLKCAKE